MQPTFIILILGHLQYNNDNSMHSSCVGSFSAIAPAGVGIEAIVNTTPAMAACIEMVATTTTRASKKQTKKQGRRGSIS
jgi:hypothetical protein